MLKKAIFLILITPPIIFLAGCPPEPEPSIFGSWSADSMRTDGMTATDLVITFSADGTFTILLEAGGAPMMEAGTFTPATAPADTELTFTIEDFIGHNAPAPPITFYLKYSNLTDTTVDISSDGAGDGYGDGATTFTKVATPDPDKFFGTWACKTLTADAMPMNDVFLTMAENGTFSIVMYTSDFGYQTGTFTPAIAPADTDLTFTVGTSSGPNQPPQDTTYKLKYSNLTDHAAEIYLDPMNDGGYDGPFDFIR